MDHGDFLKAWPTYDDNSLRGDIGMAFLKLAVSKGLGWAFRDKPQVDLGIDGELEVRDEDKKTRGRLVSVQVKCGRSFFRAETERGYQYRPKPEHLNYWLNYSTPVILVLVDDERGVCFWEHVHPKNLFSVGGVNIIEVPKSQTVDADNRWLLDRVARGVQQLEIVRSIFKVWLAESTFFEARWNNDLQTPRDFHGYAVFCDTLRESDITCADVVLGRPQIDPEEVEEMLSLARRNYVEASLYACTPRVGVWKC